MTTNLLYLVLGLPLLFYGGDFLVSGSVRLSKFLRVSPFVIGATVIGFGTSAPELAVSIMAASDGLPELAMGNVIGSNIANVGLVLGLTSLLIALTIQKKRFKDEAPPLVIATFLVTAMVWDFKLSQIESAFMVFLLLAYLWRAFSNKEDVMTELEEEDGLFAGRGIGAQGGLIVMGLVGIVLGAKFLVDGSVGIARFFGVSDWLIGITIVAVGTSLPEIVSSLIAAKRGHGEIAIGNVFGSNIFNLLMVLGITGSIQPLNIQEPIHADLLFTTALTCLLLLLIRMRYQLNRKHGILLLLCYTGYIVFKGWGTL